MTTYWMHPSADELLRWHTGVDDGATIIDVLVRIAPDGYEALQRVYRAMGMIEVDRDLLEGIYTLEEVEDLEERALVTARKLEKSGAIASAIEELNLAGFP